MRKTPFAGFTQLDVDEPLTTDGGSFLSRNPLIADFFAKFAKTHRHDGHAALASPATAPTLTAQATGGGLAPDLTVTACFTLLDADGGETLPSPVAAVTTPASIDPPTDAPTAVVQYTAGGLLVDTYAYVLTLTDGAGGETLAGPAVTVVRESGFATAQIVLSGLAAIVAASDGATGWRLYRAKGASEFEFLTAGAGDTFTDDGTTALVYDQSPPPDNNTTNAGAQVTVNVPAAAVAGSNGWRLYVSTTGDFTSPTLIGGDRAPADAGQDIVLTQLAPVDGAPPDVSTSVGGAAKIKATTDIDWTGYAGDAGGGGGNPAEGTDWGFTAGGAPIVGLRYVESSSQRRTLVEQPDWTGYAFGAAGTWDGDHGDRVHNAGGVLTPNANFSGDPADTELLIRPVKYGGVNVRQTAVIASGDVQLDFIVGNPAQIDYVVAGLTVAPTAGDPNPEVGVYARWNRAAGTLELYTRSTDTPDGAPSLLAGRSLALPSPPVAGDACSLTLKWTGSKLTATLVNNTQFLTDPISAPASDFPAIAGALQSYPGAGVAVGGRWTNNAAITFPYFGFWAVAYGEALVAFSPDGVSRLLVSNPAFAPLDLFLHLDGAALTDVLALGDATDPHADTDADYHASYYYRDGLMHLIGQLTPAASGSSALASVPVPFAPRHTTDFAVFDSAGTLQHLVVHTDGTITRTTAGAATISLEQVSWPL